MSQDAKVLWSILEEMYGSGASVSSGDAAAEIQRPILGTANGSDITYKHCEEMVRFGASVLHNIASIIGGVASQVPTRIGLLN